MAVNPTVLPGALPGPGSVPAGPKGHAAAAQGPHSGPPVPGRGRALVGRAAETALFDAALAGSGAGHAPAVLDVAGEAGIGKTRLLGEMCVRARQAGMTVLRGRATEYERHTPFQMFTDAFADAELAGAGAKELLAAAAPVLYGVRGAHDGDGSGPDTLDRFGLYRAVRDLLALLGGDAGLVVILDDLHWADSASQELLDYLVRHPARGRVLLVVARRERQTPTSVAATLRRGADAGVVGRLTLGPLDEAQAVAALAPDLSRRQARELYAVSEGNPLYLLTLLHAFRSGTPLLGLEQYGRTVPADGDAYSSGDIPSGLGALLLDELGALPSVQQRVAQAVAVLGDHATSAMLERVCDGIGSAEVRRCLTQLAARDLLRPGTGQGWALRHPMLRAVVYEHTPLERRIDVHRRAAEELARAGASAVERAHHVEQSLTGWDPAAAEVLSEAASAVARTAPETAGQLLAVLLRIMPDTAEFAARRGELTLARARSLGVSGNLRESRDLLHGLLGAPTSADPALRTEAIALCAVMERHLGHSPEAAALLRAELSRVPGPAPEQAVPLGLALGMSALLTVSYPEVRAEMAAVLALARAHGDQVGAAAALALSALGEAYEGETGAARELADAAAELVDGLTDPSLAGLCEALVWLSWAEALLERHPQAERHTDRGLDIARRTGQLCVLPHLLASRAYVHLNTCRLETALEAAEEAESVARAIGSSELLAFTLAFTPLIQLVAAPLGESRAMAIAEEAVTFAGRSDTWWASLARCMLGHTALASGDPQRALEAIVTAGGGTDLRRLQPSIRPAQLETLVAAALATGQRDRAERWADRAMAEAERLDLAGQRGAALRARATLAEHRGDHAGAVGLLTRAASAYASCGASLWEAYTLLRTVPLLRTTGDQAGAAVLRQRVRAIAGAGGARLLSDLAALVEIETPPVVPQVPTGLAELTARELEVAGLVADGLSNQAIATRLFLSRRTVETHVSTIYRKVGVASRSALASLVTHVRLAGPGSGSPAV
ncbi:ATP-binding protein [Streptacidiphilus melanogenes]|uniref:ATP-binding protein n=1 Tax=Streptacidiphilus melanogenes TaxID=411235 RepID=UPI001F411BC0|nr:helix-turn-helix transcriptional regulator [Streptacidiphilus melanogenes]